MKRPRNQAHQPNIEHACKNSQLFIHLLYQLKRTYRRAQCIVLIVDNYAIHKSLATRRWLAQNPKFELVFHTDLLSLG